MDKEVVFSHVTLAVAHVVFRIPPNDWSVFDQDLVPAKSPPKGLGTSPVAWRRTLNDIERELHLMDPKYRQLDLDIPDARETINKSVLKICIYITNKIMALPERPPEIDVLTKKALTQLNS